MHRNSTTEKKLGQSSSFRRYDKCNMPSFPQSVTLSLPYYKFPKQSNSGTVDKLFYKIIQYENGILANRKLRGKNCVAAKMFFPSTESFSCHLPSQSDPLKPEEQMHSYPSLISLQVPPF